MWMEQMRRGTYLALTTFFVLAAPLSGPVCAASRVMTLLDTDKNGTIDMNEANTAANAFLAEHQPDKKKYLKLIAKWFKAADLNGDGRIDEQELHAPEGKIFSRLLGL
jgi:Ca2+-binding EF-hand superfamily protein